MKKIFQNNLYEEFMARVVLIGTQNFESSAVKISYNHEKYEHTNFYY